MEKDEIIALIKETISGELNVRDEKLKKEYNDKYADAFNNIAKSIENINNKPPIQQTPLQEIENTKKNIDF